MRWFQHAAHWLAPRDLGDQLDALEARRWTEGVHWAEAQYGPVLQALRARQQAVAVSDEQRLDAVVFFAKTHGRLMKASARVH